MTNEKSDSVLIRLHAINFFAGVALAVACVIITGCATKTSRRPTQNEAFAAGMAVGFHEKSDAEFVAVKKELADIRKDLNKILRRLPARKWGRSVMQDSGVGVKTEVEK